MNNINDEEQKILNESPDFDNQMQILDEEKKLIQKRRKYQTLIASVFLLIVLIFTISYSTIYVYREYGDGICDNCDYINKEPDVVVDPESIGPKINEDEEKKGKPLYNIDYFNDNVATYNIDLFGDHSELFNPVNIKDNMGKCLINCDNNNDGWPDTNIDLNGDGIPELNISTDDGKTCSLNCDINQDRIPDTNIDLNGDGVPDINITTDNWRFPVYNIDYKKNLQSTFNILNEDGSTSNPVNDKRIINGREIIVNYDIDDDGWPDINIIFPGQEDIKNEKIDNNKYINIDIDGDGIPDINVSSDNGNTLINPVNKPGNYQGKDIILNKDVDGDGWPDLNIDIDNDGIPDLNVSLDGNVCLYDCDTNGDGKRDTLIKIADKIFKRSEINIDYDYDGICDLNCDLNSDMIPDINLDLNDDSLPDLNVDYYNNKSADYNLDTNGDGIPDMVLSNEFGNYTNLDDKTEKIILEITKDPSTNQNVYVLNPIDIKADNIDTGWEQIYQLNIKNDTNYAVKYRLSWNNVINEFTEINNLDYRLLRNGSEFMNGLKAPYSSSVLKDNILVKAGTTIRYTVVMWFTETNVNQNIDSGKTFKGQFTIDILK